MSGSSSSVFSSRWAPFQGFHNRSASSMVFPANHESPKLDAFDSHVCAELRRLEEFGNYLSADWLRQALELCLSVHSMVEDDFPQIGLNSMWVNEHLEDSVKLLDICNVLRESMHEMKQYEDELEVIVHGFQGSGPICARQLIRAKAALGNLSESSPAKAKEASQSRSRLENCSSMLRRMGEKLVARSSDAATAGGGADFLEPIYASKALTVFVCGVLVAALSHKSNKRPLPQPCAGNSPWACSLQTLHHKVREEIEKGRNKGNYCTLLYELRAVDSSSRCLHDLINTLMNIKSVPPNEKQALELRQSVESLKKCISELGNGTAPFERQINELFRVLVSGRMALLDILSYS